MSYATPLGRKDWLAGLVILALFVLMLAATWQRWTHPIIDHGREMNVPARILAGERLYVDIFLHYGPFAPVFQRAPLLSVWNEAEHAACEWHGLRRADPGNDLLARPPVDALVGSGDRDVASCW